MIPQQALIRRRQQKRRQADQLTIPMEQELSRRLRYEQYLALWTLRMPLAEAIQSMRYEVYDIMDTHCDTIAAALQELLLAVGNCISVLSGPDLAAEIRPYPVILKLSLLHRILIDAQVLVGDVRGQCRCGRLATDPTGSYWHLRMSVRDVVKEYQTLLHILKQESSTPSQPHSFATA